jgi:glutamine---fructose-6-phosphate transaminase (isomerizing)
VMASNLKEMKARGTPLIVLGVGRDPDLIEVADVYLALPETDGFIVPVTASIALQQLAYYTADALGMDIDKPRNLAKSVTVE